MSASGRVDHGFRMPVGSRSLSFEILLFFGTYVALTLIVDAAMKKYGNNIN